ncbi:MAG TPA: hypothetical protein VK912_07205 [Longimicrobiales bacterium]|nr:hypothetical protein [Longimicrobiales bacterium]
MTCTMFVGFSFTYFGPIARGVYPDVSPVVHVHGWSFFAWYMVLPLQAALIRARNVAIHRTLGLASLGLGAVMVAVGLIVSVVQIHLARAPDGSPFWRFMGLPIFSSWVLFTVFYVEAMRRRRRVEDHKRLILLASAVALGAATFRIAVRIAGPGPSVSIVGMLASVIFPLIAMINDRRRAARIHPAFAWGIPGMVLTIAGTFLLGATPAGDMLAMGLARIGWLLMPLYAP